ncbi:MULTISPECIES: DegV family protein [unclassified Paenibacillus]|uniref:DegV family protein n=1 Tax=unclassified Paenibacillus TaxID=185978 RepID=UPI0024059406|nr:MULTISPECIES: DegV family protein [unclassified Paenibacillus]MDF9842915.1 DegV family protein with EDD domain [Paenibacillus sp. PastF-2]MDF9849503.1 DegV family protein with EDD domain [Paenibacillus sp. PastM-2]MDF9856122.1 DegV family protein with EDD domain [Paenibacillus sp. PastF-1]MDH6481346.1 DegV family protein with EDD domain [Paenibacillus sp. PastH-2]MDH6508811.1 DegV family protein with EDD domain [Paenibacillus sp. PastM-3]
MNRTVIVTDSTSDIPPSLAEAYGIEVVPLTLMFGEQAFRDNLDMTPEQFYERLPRSQQLPTTSQPSPVEYMNVYRSIMERYPDSPVLSFHISSGLSGTYQSAVLAKSMLEEEGDHITVVDSLSASYGFGFMVVAAGRMAAEGKGPAEILEAVEKLRQSRKLYFLVDTLEYLQKGGRIGKASAFLGTLLNIKPILSIDDEGIIYAVEKVRGRKKAVARMIELFKNNLPGIDKINVAVGHTAEPAYGEEFLNELAGHFTLEEKVLTNIGPVVGSHVGNGTLAVFIWPA